MWTVAIFFALLAAAGFAGLDLVIDRFLPPPTPGSFQGQAVALVDMLSTRDFGDWLLPFVIAMAGLMLLVLRSTRSTGFPLLYVGLVQLLTYGAGRLAAPFFGRIKPSEVLPGVDLWFAGGTAFPSAATAFCAGLFLPLVILFPRLSPLWVLPPLVAAAAGVLEQDHFVSDVAAPLALAAALAAGLSFLAEKGREW